MADMYERIDALLKERGITGAKMSGDLGMSRSFMTELRKGRAKSIKIDTAKKIANYLGVSVEYLLGEETEKVPAGNGKRSVSDDDIKFALFRGREEITDAMYEEVLNFAEYVARREEEKKRKG